MRHHGACPCTANTVRRRGGAANDCSPLLTWTPELCTVSGVAQFDTMSKALIAFLAIVHGVRTQRTRPPTSPPFPFWPLPQLCEGWVKVDTITGTSGAGCSEPPDESYEGSVVGGVDVASARRICNNQCWLSHRNSAAGGSGYTWSELYPIPHTVIGGIVKNYYCYCWHETYPRTCTRTRTTKLKDGFGNPTVSKHHQFLCPPPPPPPSPSPLQPPPPPNPPKSPYPPSFFRIVPQDSCDADTRANCPTYPYGSQSEAIAACLQEGCTGLGCQVEHISQGQRCLRTRNLEKVGYYMELSQSAGCGGVGFSGWVTNCWNATKCSTDAAAFCRGCSPCGGDGGGGDGGNPSSQLPPPSPSPLMATASMVTAAVVAAGQVSDFTASVQLSLREKVALEMGVAVEAVTLTIEAASVLLTFEVALPASVDADAAKAALATQLADPEAASAFLSTASFVVSVESIEVEPTVGPPPATSSGGDSGSKSVAAGVITILVAAALARKA